MIKAAKKPSTSIAGLLPAILLSATIAAEPAMADDDLEVDPQQCETNVPEKLAASENLAQAQEGSDAEPGKGTKQEAIGLSADKVVYDSENDIVTASGDVELTRDGYRLQADDVVWNRKTGKVTATGNIRSSGPNGETAYGETIELTDSLREGMVENLLIVLQQGGRLAAKSGERREDGSLSLDFAAYTPCVVVGLDGDPKEPTWQVRADKVDYDPEKNRIKYKGARIELFGLPVVPLPGLSHPADDAPGSGFLVPSIRFSRNNGGEVEIPYYWRLSPNRDITASLTGFTEVAPLAYARYRSLGKTGAFQVSGYGTFSRRLSLTGGPATGDRAIRGYIDGSGRFQIDPNWSVSGSLRVASDRTFLRRYDISRDDRLRNNLSIERISENSYLSIGGWAVQTLRVGEQQGLTPIALPEIDYRLRLDDPVLGGKLQLQANTLAIGRTAGQDTQRAFASAEWNLRRITTLGQEVSFTLLSRGDIYNTSETAATVTELFRGDEGFTGRGIFAAAAEVKWPFVGSAFGGTHVITPRVQLVAADATSNFSVPNEDSRAVDLEDTNLFALNRFPGFDRFEDNFRITFGVDWKLRAGDFNVDVNIGQSYRLSDRATIFPDGTGLSEKTSDIVGRNQVRFKDLVTFTHRYRLDKDSLAVRRNEVDATIGTKGTYLQVGYLRLDRDIDELEDLADREEIRLGARATITPFWSVFGSTIIDLTSTDEDPFTIADGFEPIRTRLGVAYEDDCLSIGLTWRRDFQDTGDALRGNSFRLKISFKHLGV